MKPPESASPFIVLVSKGEMLKVQHEGAAKLVIESEEAGAHLVGPVCCTLFGINKYWIALYEGPVCRFPPKTPLSLWQSFIPPAPNAPGLFAQLSASANLLANRLLMKFLPVLLLFFIFCPFTHFTMPQMGRGRWGVFNLDQEQPKGNTLSPEPRCQRFH